jgi:anaerobic selenocysteine-containing dehydrogenase
VTLHPLDAERIGASEGSTVTVSAAGQGVRLPVLCSGAVPRGVALVPFNQPGDDIRSLVSRGSDVTDVRIEAK